MFLVYSLLIKKMEPIKEFSRTVLSLDNCIVPMERLLQTPSMKDGMSHDLETDLRIVGCEYIQSAGLLLRLPQVSERVDMLYSLFMPFFPSLSLPPPPPPPPPPRLFSYTTMKVAMATAQVLFQRYYYSKSFVKYHIQVLRIRCLYSG